MRLTNDHMLELIDVHLEYMYLTHLTYLTYLTYLTLPSKEKKPSGEITCRMT